ncbi:MAG: hypothetical protein GKR88_00840 [Flavobacteriaceae bacterium]|nr:MAG: hypothetical protein GKR88_00840 [Flavobacteriaceae bacterium]
MRILLAALIVLGIISIGSCRKDFSTVPSSGNLTFSKDTVYLDTIFTNIGSATYNLKVYNRSGNDITIPGIRLENGTNSKYRLNVDGIPGKSFQDIAVLARDSIYIFVETTIDITTISNPLYTDRILFDIGSNEQDVDLVTLVQDATFIYPGRDPVSMEIDVLTLDGQPTTIQGRFLADNELNFTNTKPYVLYGYAAVAEDKTLTIDAGAKIHFHDNSGLIIDRKASLKVNGTLSDKVIFEGDRLEHSFSNIPGQWGVIWMRAGSMENEVNHAEVKNGSIGFLVDSIGTPTSPTLTLTNTQIYNHSNYGLLARQSNISGENIVIGNAGQASLAATIGGTYNFTHATFANYWSNSVRQLPTVLVNNFFTFTDNNGQEITETRDLLVANFNNCIIDGNSNIEFILDRVDGSQFNFGTSNCMIKFNDTNNTFSDISELDFSSITNYPGVILNGNPNFRNTSINDFMIGQLSDGINKANGAFSSLIPLDILGVDRTSAPDIGAYQHIDF